MKKKLFLIASIMCAIKLVAQTSATNFSLPVTIPNAPTAASLGRYGEIPVSYNTGVPDISIPVFNIQSGELTLPISISYHGSGIKVSDMSGSVGLGWSLNAGGCISRVVQGIPDESNEGGYQLGFSNMIFPQEDDPVLSAKEKCIAAKITDPNDYGSYADDGQPDLFFYNFNGKSGKFIYKNKLISGLAPGFMTIPYVPLQITKNSSNFSIIDEDGIQYIFSNQDNTVKGNAGHYTSPSVITAWHITQVISTDKTDTISFQYISNSINLRYSAPTSIIQTLNYTNTAPNGTSSFVIPANPTEPITTITESLVSEIDFKNGKVVFNYSNGTLSNIQIFNKLISFSLIKQFNFFQSTFITHQSSYPLNTLRLDSLQEQGSYSNYNQVNPSYAFNYYTYNSDAYTTYEAPSFNSNAQDLWGYFNGQLSNSDLLMVKLTPNNSNIPPINAAYKREPDSNYLKVGTLKSIKYPTGGKTTFDFEPNQKVIQKQTATVYKTSVSAYITESITNYISFVQFTLTRDLQRSQTPDLSKWYNSKLVVSGYPMCTVGSTCIHNDPTIYLTDLTGGGGVDDGATVTLISLNQTNPTSTTQTFYLNLIKNHTYKLYFPNPVVLSPGQTYQNRLDATFTGSYLDSTVYATSSQTVLTGGLRIRQIISDDASGHSYIKQYKYPGSYFNSQLFNGDFDDLAMNSYKFENWDDLHTGDSDPTGNFCALLQPVKIFWAENTPLPLGSGGNSISYNEVEEYETDGNGNYLGKTVYDYNQSLDMVTPGMPFYKVDNDYKRSRLIQKRIYKSVGSDFILQQKLVNNYQDLNSILQLTPDTVKFYSAHGLVDNYQHGGHAMWDRSDGCFGCSEYFGNNYYLINKFYYISDKTVLKSTITTEYSNAGDSLSSTVTYDYANPNHLLATHVNTVTSKGIPSDSYLKYPLDYTYSSCNNTAYSNLLQQLAGIKQTYYTATKKAYDSFVLATVKLYPCNNTDRTEGVLDQQNFDAAQNNFNNATSSASQLIVNYNSTINSYNACTLNYFNSASDDQKGIMNLQNQNNISPVLQETKYKNGNLLSTYQTYYKAVGLNMTKPSRIMFATLNTPVESRIIFDSYNSNGNITQQHKANDVIHSYIWGYNNILPMAEAINAASNEIYFTSFEDGNGWDAKMSFSSVHAHSGVQAGYINNSSATEKFSYAMMRDTFTTPLTSDKKFHYSGWIYSTGPGVQIWLFTKKKDDPNYYSVADNIQTTTTGQWVFLSKDYIVPAGTLELWMRVDNNSTGEVWFDDLRFHPSDAQMITYTYEPLIGITSQSDINNRITTYEYDGLGRLSLIRDQDGNIIKKYQYAYQSANPGGSTACSTSNCAGVDEKCVNGFCEKAKRINTSTVLVKSGTNAGKWKCSFYYQWSDASTSPANAFPDDNSVPARKTEYNLFPCDIIQP